ncbi:Kelch-like member 7 [Diaporthe australafricana]|uniref:Kelch-like member 7 n=1 Tax=Diaporthe australafricana TaxID=127596 RepID=A0ABR3W8L3_9PEZI
MSDCTVVCGNVKWHTHKTILCSRNKWFRVALDGPFQEASNGVVAIEDRDPDVVRVVLNYIYTGGITYNCSTPAKIVEIWKAGDFFDIHDLVVEAQTALATRFKASAKFFSFSPEPKTMKTTKAGGPEWPSLGMKKGGGFRKMIGVSGLSYDRFYRRPTRGMAVSHQLNVSRTKRSITRPPVSTAAVVE